MNLAEAFAEEAARRKDAEWTGLLCSVIRQAIAPFDTGKITISIEEAGFSMSGRTLWFEIETLRSYPFRFKYDEWVAYQAYDPVQYLFESVREPLFNHFRYRPSLPVDDHIVLGED